MKKATILIACMFAVWGAQAVESERIHLSGRGADDAVEWGFRLEAGRGSGEWTTIPVPSCWELQGFGTYEYLDVTQNTGFYRTAFAIPQSAQGKRILIFFEGVLCQTDVTVNGKSAGPPHQGGFYRFSYDITDLVKPADNLLEVTVKKKCDNEEVDKTHRGDYWNFGGIFRPVYLEVVPPEYIDWFAVHGDMDGTFALDVYPQHVEQADAVRATVEDLQGNLIGKPLEAKLSAGQEKVSLNGFFDGVRLWSDESPHLYRVHVELLAGETVVHKKTDRFGFRRFENRPGEGFFLNGKRVVLKGAARHCFWPETGRTLTEDIDRTDVELIKNFLNMNFVRCVHYPPDQRFLDLCDEIGLMASSELTGWHSRVPTEPGRALVKALVAKDVNHPSVVQWHNANHAGNNPELIPEYAIWDPQNRMVIQNEGQKYSKVPGLSRLGEQAVDSRYYPNFAALSERLAPGKLNTVQPNETLHALYDGGGGAALHTYYRALRSSGAGGGIVIWALVDEAVVRTDRDGELDGVENRAPDGVVGPYRELEGSAYACREIFSPVRFLELDLTGEVDTSIPVANEYASTSLDQVSFAWELLTYPGPFDAGVSVERLAQGSVQGPSVQPGTSGVLKLDLPAERTRADALRIRAVNKNGIEVISKTWPLKTRSELLAKAFSNFGEPRVSGYGHTFNSGGATFSFDPDNGMLTSVAVDGEAMTFKQGPQFVWSVSTGAEVENNEEGVDAVALKALGEMVTSPTKDKFDSPWSVQALDMSDWVSDLSRRHGRPVIEARDPEGKGFFRWTVLPDGTVRLDYSYELPQSLYGYAGIVFELAEESVQSKRWLGGGPVRVWKNRLHGPEFGLWENESNDGIPGEVWALPAFKGNFKDVCWASFQTRGGQIVVGLEDPDAYLGVLRPKNGGKPRRALWSYPTEGGLFVFNAISPVGAKWRDSREAGPDSSSNQINGPIAGTVLFRVSN